MDQLAALEQLVALERSARHEELRDAVGAVRKAYMMDSEESQGVSGNGHVENLIAKLLTAMKKIQERISVATSLVQKCKQDSA